MQNGHVEAAGLSELGAWMNRHCSLRQGKVVSKSGIKVEPEASNTLASLGKTIDYSEL